MKTLAELGDLSGRLALVTGGAGHLGRAFGTALAELGATVVLVDRAPEPLVVAADAFVVRGLPAPITLVADLESEAERTALAARIAADHPALHVLVNNAAFVGDSALQGWAVPFDEQRIDTWRRALEVNLTAPFHLVQLLAPLLRSSGKASVVNVGSIYGLVGPDSALYAGTTMGNPAAYAGSKGGLLQLTRWLATSLAPDVRVNAITPGGIARNQPERFAASYIQRTPLQRMGTEEDFIGALQFLASDLSRWVTGQNIIVDGGWTAW